MSAAEALVRVRRALSCLFALSRTPHALLDLAPPAAAAVLWLNGFPPVRTILLGALAAFAGYTSVYALNDIVDCREDRKRLKLGCQDYGDYLDATLIRHPIAECAISMRSAVAWAGTWGAAALAGAILLNPVCALIFVGAFALEAGYCLLCRVTPLRTLMSGIVKSAGPLAAVFAVDPSPDPLRLALLFAWLFLWEIGGQNIPSDWSDIDEDRVLGHKTLPVRLREKTASRLALAAVCASIAASLFLTRGSSPGGTALYIACSLAAGAVLLLAPALMLVRTSARAEALVVFNRASWYPVTMLAAAAAGAALRV